MRRGELFRVHRPGADPKNFRTYLIVGREALINSKFSTVICAPVYPRGQGLSTQVPIGIEEGMKHFSWIWCDNLVSVEKSSLTQYVGSLSASKLAQLNRALQIALELSPY